jgi:flagellar hook-basal body complex protein FliE
MALPIAPAAGAATPELAFVRPTQVAGAGNPTGAGETTSFVDTLREVAHQINEVPAHAEKVAEAYANGSQNDIHGTMISMAQADISLRLVSNVRNRVIEAYREVMRMGA